MAERRNHLAAHPRSYLGVTRAPEDGGGPASAEDALAAGRRALEELLADDAFAPADGPTYFVYRLIDGDHQQSGLVCGVATTDYDTGVVRIHEQINRARSEHLARHLRVVGAQSSPIAMAFRSAPAVTAAISATAENAAPFLDVSDERGLRQQLWRVPESANEAITNALAAVPLYLIDGHHRAAAASSDLRHVGGDPEEHQMLSVLFPCEELRNQAFHRVIAGLDHRQLIDNLAERFTVRIPTDLGQVVGRAPTEVALAVPAATQGAQPIWRLIDIPFDHPQPDALQNICLLYTSDAADD